MKTTALKIIATIVLMGALFTNCKKTETGPKGDKGDKGADGINGINGTNGTNGSTVTVTSYTVNTNTGSWLYTAPSWTASATIPQLTANIANNGAVIGYLETGLGTGQWLPLPKVSYISATVQGKYQFDFLAGTINLYYSYSDYSTPPNPGNQVFRFVLIPPAMMKPNINYNNFDEVKIAYNLN